MRKSASSETKSDRFSPDELRILLKLNSPAKIQRFLDEDVSYNLELNGPTCRSPRRVLRDRLAHCMEGALFAAAALEVHGHPPTLLDLEAVRDDDHVLAVYQVHGFWGAIAKSKYASLRFREPVYRTVRELVMSYFEHYHNLKGEKSLRAYSRPVSLLRFANWRTAEEDVWAIPEHLAVIHHTPLLRPSMEKRLNLVDNRLRQSEIFGLVP
ncbi:MAG: hypothetical protein NZV14_16050 [Bryobacteraceae bacterium]|nr:hypothetical protein [Bryobacteraceae bacterium]MDW8379674.1 hypothetical protein [Bryobacterales bacterium]